MASRAKAPDPDHVVALTAVPNGPLRIEALDVARGVAVSLMILSHGVKGLLDFTQFPDWGLVPIHLITKFSSTLFILVFGISIAMVHLPHAGTATWRKRRLRLWTRAIILLFWYKALTVVEMFHLYSREDILKTLSYAAFPVYVEILGFYALALLWVPLLLPHLKRMPVSLQLFGTVGLYFVSHLLYARFDFWGIEQLKAILVEHDNHYCWGQLSRAPLVFLGIVLGTLIRKIPDHHYRSISTSLLFLVLSLISFAAFLIHSDGNLSQEWISLALNRGKHPPELNFLFFSSAGAFLVLGLSFLGGAKLARFISPISLIGKDALQAFIFHIVVLFVFYRYLFDYWHKIPYERALGLTLLLLVLTAAWIKVVHWLRNQKS